jgi:hypothetical protein
MKHSSRNSRANKVAPALEQLEPRCLLSNGVPRLDHVVLVIEENKDYDQVIGNPAAPYINSLAQTGANMINSHGLEHPSEPNYLDLFSGADHFVLTDPCVTSFDKPSLGEELLNNGDTFNSYSESMQAPGFLGCNSGGSAGYYRNGNPGLAFPDIPKSLNQPFQGYFPTDFTKLPTFSYVVPNEADSSHSGTIAVMDSWLQTNLGPYVTWAQTHNSLFIVTFDEGYPLNHIPTVFAGAQVKQGQYSEYTDHFGVLRTIEDMYSLPYAAGSANAKPITDIWTTSQAPVTMAPVPAARASHPAPAAAPAAAFEVSPPLFDQHLLSGSTMVVSLPPVEPVLGTGRDTPFPTESGGKAESAAHVPLAHRAGTNGDMLTVEQLLPSAGKDIKFNI